MLLVEFMDEDTQNWSSEAQLFQVESIEQAQQWAKGRIFRVYETQVLRVIEP